MLTVLAGAFLVALLATADVIPWIIRIARRTGFLDHPGPRKIHTEPMPYGGGIAVAFGVILAVGGGVMASWLHRRYGWLDRLPSSVTIHAGGVMARAPVLAVYGAGALLMLLVGLVDDKRRLSPLSKLTCQILIATGTVVGGGSLSLFMGSGWIADLVRGAVTVLWIVSITNAFNLLDHMDGLSSGVALLASVAFCVIAIPTGQLFLAASFAALAGACVGFLCFNFPPARIFLGDAGSLFIGYCISTLTISFTFYHYGEPFYEYAAPLVVLSVPIFDTARVVLLRVRERRPVFQGDQNHFAHRLLALGLSRRSAVLTIYVLTLVTGISAVLLYQVNLLGAGIILSQLILIFAIITILEVAGRARGRVERGP